jgi:hypothetical protein
MSLPFPLALTRLPLLEPDAVLFCKGVCDWLVVDRLVRLLGGSNWETSEGPVGDTSRSLFFPLSEDEAPEGKSADTDAADDFLRRLFR